MAQITAGKASKATKGARKATKGARKATKGAGGTGKASKATRRPDKAKEAAKAVLAGLPAPIQSRALVASPASVALALIDRSAYAHHAASEQASESGEFSTREAWLMMVIDTIMRPLFQRRTGKALPDNIRVAVGFPSTGRNNKRIGEVWSSTASADKHFEIFIHIGLDTVIRVLDVLVHELVHVVVGLDEGHGKAFKHCAKRVGLVGQMRSTTAGEELAAFLSKAIEVLPPYPGARLETGGESNKPKKQTTRMIKCVCASCGYVARTTRKWLSCGVPSCYCGNGPLTPDADEYEDADE